MAESANPRTDQQTLEKCLQQTDCKTERTFNIEEQSSNLSEMLNSASHLKRANLSLKKLTYSPVRMQDQFSYYPRSNAQNYNEIKNLKRTGSVSKA